MRRLLILGLGAGMGYVMGTRAGRGRYLEMKNAWEKAVHEGSAKLSETKLGESLGIKQGSGASMSTGSSYSGSMPYSSGMEGSTSESSAVTDLRDSADDTARGF